MSAAEIPARRPKSARGEGDRLRQDLLESAANLMATHGDVDSISLRAVARNAGVSATAVYRHFDDHLTLLREASEYCWANFRDALADARLSSTDPFLSFRAHGRGLRPVRHRSPRAVPRAVLQQARPRRRAVGRRSLRVPAARRRRHDDPRTCSTTIATRTSSPPRSTPGSTGSSTSATPTRTSRGRDTPDLLDGLGIGTAAASPAPESRVGERSCQVSLRPRNRADAEEAGVGDHAVVGSHGLPLDVPSTVEHLDRAGVDPLALERLAHLRRLGDRRRVRHQQPAGGQHPLGVRHDLPRFGDVEHHTVEGPVGRVDALVAVGDVDVVPLERRRTEEALDVLAGPVGEVLADLVADDLRAVAQHRHRQRARNRSRSRTPAPPDRCRRGCRSGRDPSDRSPARRAASRPRSPRASAAARCTPSPSSSARRLPRGSR